MLCNRHFLSSRTCVPDISGRNIIPRPTLLQPFRSSQHWHIHSLPRWESRAPFKTVPFAPVRIVGRPKFYTVQSSPPNQHVKMGSVLPFERKHKVTVVGSGNW